jgi:hypothetical protein
MSATSRGLAARLKALPEGAILRQAFRGLLALAAVMVFLDLRETMEAAPTDPFASPATAPVTMERPTPDDQVRPYLPRTRPMAPGRTEGPPRDPERFASEAAPMRFRLGTHGAAFADGTITPGTSDAFSAFLAEDANAGVSEIVLDSPGGSVSDAMDMARAIRDRGISTRVLPDGYCASSCPLVFAGGKQRVAAATSWIGVHQVFALSNVLGSLAEGMDEGQRVSGEAQQLLVECGVDPRVWTHAMMTPKDKLYLFTPKELSELKLATKVEGEMRKDEHGKS